MFIYEKLHAPRERRLCFRIYFANIKQYFTVPYSRFRFREYNPVEKVMNFARHNVKACVFGHVSR